MTADSCTFSLCSSTRHPPVAVPSSCLRQHEPGWNEPGTALCHQRRPRPARRRRLSLNQNSRARRRTAPWMSMHGLVLVVLVSILLCCQQVEAATPHGHGSRRRTDLLFDNHEPPQPRMRLQERNEDSHKSKHNAHSHSSKSRKGDSGVQTAAQDSQIPLPHPFDTSLGNNFTAPSCPAFFNNFLTNDTFNACLPFSLLLQVCTHLLCSDSVLPTNSIRSDV